MTGKVTQKKALEALRVNDISDEDIYCAIRTIIVKAGKLKKTVNEWRRMAEEIFVELDAERSSRGIKPYVIGAYEFIRQIKDFREEK